MLVKIQPSGCRLAFHGFIVLPQKLDIGIYQNDEADEDRMPPHGLCGDCFERLPMRLSRHGKKMGYVGNFPYGSFISVPPK